QRYCAVKYPLQTPLKNTNSFNSIILILSTLIGLTYCLLLVYKNSIVQCYEELSLNWFISDALLSFLLPFALISFFNQLIIRQI
ncbi:unnamed protein product, partial [Didymodactylos carnosus]